MKYYKLLKDLPTFKTGEKFRLDDDGSLYYYKSDNGYDDAHWLDKVMAYHHKTLEKFPNILEDWFEEPKESWFIDESGEIVHYPDDISKDYRYKEIGNCFYLREEAELAVRKLKAWKRLKDSGFVFHCGNPMFDHQGDHRESLYGMAEFEVANYKSAEEDLKTIFGGAR